MPARKGNDVAPLGCSERLELWPDPAAGKAENMNIGEPVREILVEPLEDPVPRETPDTEDLPTLEPAPAVSDEQAS
jgi:hypothetical protein